MKPGRRDSREHRQHRRRPDAAADDTVLLYGIHAVAAALANETRQLRRLRLTENAEQRLAKPLAAVRDRLARPPERASPRDLDHVVGDEAVHQGVLLETTPLPDLTLADTVGTSPPPLLVVLDQVTDPHNVGAVLRSAAAFGASGLVLTRRHAPPLAGALAKAASGALELVPVVGVANLARALAELAGHGIACIGLDGDAARVLEEEDALSGPVALVLGAEGRGLRRLTGESCDRLCRITTPGRLTSLNVSNAAAVALHTAAIRRRLAGI